MVCQSIYDTLQVDTEMLVWEACAHVRTLGMVQGHLKG